MNLGEKLRATILREAKEKAEREQRELQKKQMMEMEARREKEMLVARIRAHIVEKITDGKTPHFLVAGYSDRQWIMSCNRINAKNIPGLDLWLGLAEWCKSEGLILELKHDHDGFGERSWIVVTARPVPLPEYEAD